MMLFDDRTGHRQPLACALCLRIALGGEKPLKNSVAYRVGDTHPVIRDANFDLLVELLRPYANPAAREQPFVNFFLDAVSGIDQEIQQHAADFIDRAMYLRQ